MDWQEILAHAPDRIQKAFIRRKHSKECSILFPDEENDYLYILTSGHADVMMQSASGAVITMYAYEAYSCFGELELFKSGSRTYDVICRTDCETLSLHKDRVFEWMQSDFELTRLIIRQLAEKLQNASQAIGSLSLFSVKDRLLYCIYVHHKKGDLCFFTKANACAETGIPLRSLNRSLAECESEGLINFSKKRFGVASPQRLEAYCQSLL